MNTLREYLQENAHEADRAKLLAGWMNGHCAESSQSLEGDLREFARQIMDNLPRLHEQSLDTLIRLATEKAHAAGMRFELVAETMGATHQPTDRLAAIEARLDALESDSQCMVHLEPEWVRPEHERTRTYPDIEWRQNADPQTQDAYLSDTHIGSIFEDGDWRLFAGGWQYMKDGNMESAKNALESKFCQWWDELHANPTP